MAVCDVATNIMFKTISQETTRTNEEGGDTHENSAFMNAIQGARDADRMLDKRYEGTFYTQAGMSTDQIVNKMCVAAITGDWSILTDNILTSIDQNEVEPIFGPMFPESRMQGYNPFTGELTIMYTFTYGVVSGGQAINTKVSFICDKNRPGGDYCPEGRITSEEAGSSFNVRSLYTPEGGSMSKTIRAIDKSARFRYNVIQLEHKYSVKGETKIKMQEEEIFAKGEFMLANCYFSGGVMGSGAQGLQCDRLFTDDSLVSIYRINGAKTHLSPMMAGTSTYYPGNTVFLNLGYDVKASGNQQTGFDIAYKATCRSATEGSAVKMGVNQYYTTNADFGQHVFELFKIPTVLGESTTSESQIYKEVIRNGDFDEVKIMALNTDATSTVAARVESITVDDNEVISSGDPIIPQNLNVNVNNNMNEEIMSLLSQSEFKVARTTNGLNFPTNTEESISKNIVIKTEGASSSLKFYIAKFKDGTPVGGYTVFSTGSATSQTFTEFDQLSPGQCQLKVRLLPMGQGASATADPDAFDTYNPMGTDVQTSGNLQSQDSYETTFMVGDPNTATSARPSFELTDPFEGKSICVDSSGKFNVEYIAQSPQNNNNLDLKLTGSANLDAFGSTADFTRDVVIGKNDFQATFGNINNLNGEGSQMGTFRYEVKDSRGSDSASSTTRSSGVLVSKSFPVTFYFGSACDRIGGNIEAVTPPPSQTDETQNNGDGDSQGESGGIQNDDREEGLDE